VRLKNFAENSLTLNKTGNRALSIGKKGQGLVRITVGKLKKKKKKKE
jgi:hypothetical protein